MKHKYPRLYYQEAYGDNAIGSEQPKLRVIYPDGQCEWYCGCSISGELEYPTNPCWTSGEGICKSVNQAIRLMNAYDKKMGYPKAVYLGEIK